VRVEIDDPFDPLHFCRCEHILDEPVAECRDDDRSRAGMTERAVAGRDVVHRSRYPEPIIPEKSLPAYILEHSERFGDRAALVDATTGDTVSYRELPGVVREAARRVRALGGGPGTTVALAAANQPRWAVALLGALSAGAVAVPLNPTFTAPELEKLLGIAQCALVLADDQSAPAITRVVSGGGALARLSDVAPLTATDVPHPPDGAAGMATRRAADQDVAPSAAAVLAFSSGTSGVPKGVSLTHRNLVATLVQHEQIYEVRADDVVVAALPMFHIYGLSIVLGYALRHGATVVTLPRFRLDAYLEAIATHRVTWLHLVPPIVAQLVSEESASADMTSVRHAVSGAAPLDPRLTTLLEQRLGCRVGQGYGMTEASPGVTWIPDDGSIECLPGSVGVLVPGTEARVVDPITGDDVEGPGELWIRGPQVMSGYLDAPVETARALSDDGWLRTGDILRVDAEGVWWVVDRLKELIKYKGYQVAPAELEGVLLEHPAVDDAAVAGIPDPVAGEVPAAWVVTRRPIAAGELMAWVAERVAPYKRIRVVHFTEAIPRSPAGKTLRRKLVEGLGRTTSSAVEEVSSSRRLDVAAAGEK
jgi:acyl-CoA synthetase (AMP-forming)/AMP-acid ligase II